MISPRRLFSLGASLIVCVSVSAPIALAQTPAQEMPTIDIGSREWDKAKRFTMPVRKMHKGQSYLTCSKNYYPSPLGTPSRKIVNGAPERKLVINPKKFMTIVMRNGTKKRLRQGTQLCAPVLSPMTPPSREALSQWTFTAPRELVTPVGITRPPIDTCIAAVAPTSWEGSVVSNDLLRAGNPIRFQNGTSITTMSSKGGPDGAGAWTIRWHLTGGQGFLNYSTRFKDKHGLYRSTSGKALLNPEGTTIEVTEVMSSLLGATFVAGSWGPGVIAPDCGQNYLPSWLDGWFDYHDDSVPFDTQFVIRGSDDNPTVEMESDVWE